MADQRPWVRSERLARPWGDVSPAGGKRRLRLPEPRLSRVGPLLAIMSLLLVSLLSLGSTNALFTSTPAPLTVSTVASQPPTGPPPPAAGQCTTLRNLVSDPVEGSAINGYLEPLLTAPQGSLSNGTVGTPTSATSQGVTGTDDTPVTGTSFAIGYCDETELYEFAPSPLPAASSCPAGPPQPGPNFYSSAGQYDVCQPTGSLLTSLPSGSVTNLAPNGYQSTGPGLPYVAIYAVNSQGQITGSPLGNPTVTVSPSYTPIGAAWMGNQPSGLKPGAKFLATLNFSVSSLNLSANTTYVAYILVRDTDQSGPLADHMWYFQT